MNTSMIYMSLSTPYSGLVSKLYWGKGTYGITSTPSQGHMVKGSCLCVLCLPTYNPMHRAFKKLEIMYQKLYNYTDIASRLYSIKGTLFYQLNISGGMLHNPNRIRKGIFTIFVPYIGQGILTPSEHLISLHLIQLSVLPLFITVLIWLSLLQTLSVVILLLILNKLSQSCNHI